MSELIDITQAIKDNITVVVDNTSALKLRGLAKEINARKEKTGYKADQNIKVIIFPDGAIGYEPIQSDTDYQELVDTITRLDPVVLKPKPVDDDNDDYSMYDFLPSGLFSWSKEEVQVSGDNDQKSDTIW